MFSDRVGTGCAHDHPAAGQAGERRSRLGIGCACGYSGAVLLRFSGKTRARWRRVLSCGTAAVGAGAASALRLAGCLIARSAEIQEALGMGASGVGTLLLGRRIVARVARRSI
jgi:hypothetical protein